MSPGVKLAHFAAAVRWDDLPQVVRARTLDHIVDTVGLMCAGIDAKACVEARRAAQAWGRGEESTVVGASASSPAPTAAFLNALHGRITAYDDTYEPGTMHPGNSVIAASMALAEKHAASGTTFLAAVLAGYEVATRVAAAVSPGHYAKGFHNTGTCTVFGAAAASARVLGMNGAETAETLGLAGATAAGLRQHQIDGSIFDSAFHGARAAQSGVMAAQLRAEGVQGPVGILDGPMGFCTVMAPERDMTRLDAGLGETYEFLRMTLKPYPMAFFVHGPIETVLELKSAYEIDPRQIARVEIATFKQSMEVCDRPRVQTQYHAIVSHQYGVAVALVKNKVDLASFAGLALADPSVMELVKKVHVIHDPALENLFPGKCPHRVTIRLIDGREFSMLSEYPPGWQTPIPQQRVDTKFLEHCSARLGERRAREALMHIRGLQDCADVRELTRILRPSATDAVESNF